MKKYSSFEELDRDIAICNVQRQIDEEELKIALHKTKEAVTPSKMVTNTIGAVTSTSFILKILKPLIPYALGKMVARNK